MKKSTIFPALALSSLVTLPIDALASHKSWILQNSGSKCSLDTSNGEEDFGTALSWNPVDPNSTAYHNVVCPFSLAGRWASSGNYNFGANKRAQLYNAMVYAMVPTGQAMNCVVRGRMENDNLYFGASHWNTSTGLTTIFLNSLRNDWGGELQSHRNEELESLDVVCSMPPYASIIGYKLRTCQFNTDSCRGLGDEVPSDADGTGPVGPISATQTSGIECTATNSYGDIRIGVDGAKNYLSTPPDEGAEIVCPMTPPSDDTYTHARTMSFTKIYYTPYGPNSAQGGCAATWPPTCPSCSLEALDKEGNWRASGQFDYGGSKGGGTEYLELPFSSQRLENVREISMVARCILPPLQTIVGVSSIATQTRILQGVGGP